MTPNEINKKTIEVARLFDGIDLYDSMEIMNQAVTMIKRSLRLDINSEMFLKRENELKNTH